MLKAEIEMMAIKKRETIFVLEGNLDSEVIARIKVENSIQLVNINGLIDKTLNRKTERRKLDGNKILVEDVTKYLLDSGFLNVIGIQDTDLDSILRWYKKNKFEHPNTSKNIVQTFPARDIETLLYSQLEKSSKFTPQFPLKLEDCIKRSIVLAIIGISLKLWNSKNKTIPDIGLKKFSEEYRGKLEDYYTICKSIETLLPKVVEFNSNQLKQEHVVSLEKTVKSVNERINESNLSWSSLIRGHDLESLLVNFNNMEVRNKYVKEIKKRINDKLVRLGEYEILKSHEMFKSIEKWRFDRNLEPFFA